SRSLENQPVGRAKGSADDHSGAAAPRTAHYGGIRVTKGKIDTLQEPIMSLRGANVEVDVRRVGRALLGACLLTLAAVTVVLFVAGARKNAQITRLRQQGVSVEVSVSGCRGLMGGSGSNLVGYDCRGSFTIDGHRYSETVPGNSFHRPGAT